MPSVPIRSPEDAIAQAQVVEAIRRGIITITERRIKYALSREQTYNWDDPEEWVRAVTVAWLVIEKGYPANRIKLEVTVPRRTPSDHADIVVYSDDACREPYLVVENKASGQSSRDRDQGIEQAFGNANSLRAPLTVYDEGTHSFLFDVANHPATERRANRLGDRDRLPPEYGNVPTYKFIAGSEEDIEALPPLALEARIRRAHSLIWAGGRRDPLTAFDEWSKLLFAKVVDERTTRTGHPRRFQIGTNETTATVANRIHVLFAQACQTDPTIFPPGTRINLPDAKVTDVVRTLQGVAFTRTDVDSIGKAFEQFFGSIFRGGLGQYFTMRQLARFAVAMLNITHEDFVLDPTAGSGGFLLESLLQVWHRIDAGFAGQPPEHIQRIKYDFAKTQVYGIEVHEILARICKINLLLHHDGHTNIEGNRSALDSIFTNARLNPPQNKFTVIVGNPPFGTEVAEGDEEQLGQNHLNRFAVAAGLRKIDSEQVIVERSIELLEPGGRFGLVVPDGLLNNQGELSNCPRTRSFIARQGYIIAIISLPDHAFRKSGAQNKTSMLFFQKFTAAEKRRFESEYDALVDADTEPADAIGSAIDAAQLSYQVFLGEAAQVGYTPAGAVSQANDLYRSMNGPPLAADQEGTILGEWRRFEEAPAAYRGRTRPDCMALDFSELWNAHQSHRLDPKYHLFKRETLRAIPPGWVRDRLGNVLGQREELADFAADPDRLFQVMTIAQTGEIRARESGKGRNPPEWRASYFEESPGTWYAAHAGDVVFSSIDLWKGCIAVVPAAFDGALVSKEFPIYRVQDERLLPAFLQVLLRSRYYQRAFRAITTGHSNRRRTQAQDFEDLEVAFPPTREEQERLIASIADARARQGAAAEALRSAFGRFNDVIDGRVDEELPEVDAEPTDLDA
jgi:type I restriction enzyme M protein